MTISNSVNEYVFSGGTIAGTALVVKQGTAPVDFEATEQGPIDVLSGSLVGGGSIGTTTVAQNVLLNLNNNGQINGGLTSTGMVVFAGTEVGPISIQGGSLDNSGTMSTTSGQVVSMGVGAVITNESSGTINVGTLPVNSSLLFDVPHGSTLANFGTIDLWQPKMSVEGLLFGTGTISYPNGGGLDSIANTSDPRLVIGPLGVISPGPTPAGSIGDMNLYCRFDFNNDPEGGQGVAGVGTVRVDVDFSNPQTNDIINCDRWNNDTGYVLMTNINPGAGSFALGQVFQVLANSSGASYNYQDTLGFCPTILPYVPGPGLQWGVSNFNWYGSISVAQSPNVWDGQPGSNWSTNAADANWKVGHIYSDNQGAVFNDTAGGTASVNLTGNVAPEGYPSTTVTNTDNLTYTNVVITTNQPVIYPGIVVSNSLLNYVISGTGHIRGMTGLYKTGPGTLTLMTSNDFDGCVIVDNGTLVITNYWPLPNIVSLGVIGSGQTENDVILDGGTLDYVGTTNVNLSNGKNSCMVFNPGGGTIEVASSTNMLTINKAATGPGSLTKTGPGTLELTSTVDNWNGGTIVNAGYLELTAAAIGWGGLTLNNSSTLVVTNVTLTNSIDIAGPATGIQTLGASTNVFSGAWTDSGSVTFSNAGLFVFNGDLSGFSGIISLGTSSGVFQFNSATNKNPCTGSAAATFNLGTGSAKLDNLNGSNLVYNLGALAGGANTVLSGRSSTNSPATLGTTYDIGANGNSTTFSGMISNGVDTVSVVKVGAGALFLNGASTYTGSTTVSNGMLGGTGSIAGPLAVTSGGTLSPGTSSASVGTFTVNNTATFGGSVILKLNQSGLPATNDEVVVTGTITAGGKLVVTNIGPNIINGSTFQLFNKAVSGFGPVTLPTGGGSYVWNNNLTVNGSIQLASGGANAVNTNPTNIVATVSGNTLTLSWPADHTGWRLLVETNAVGSGLSMNSANWFTVVGSTNVNSVPVTMNPTNGNVFYRLVYP